MILAAPAFTSAPRAARSVRWWRAVRVVVALLGLSTATAAPAAAHAILKSSAPAAGARLIVAPTSLRLMFTEAPEASVSGITLTGPDGAAVSLGVLAYAPDSHRALIAPIQRALGPGRYTVTWRVMGDDGHPSEGRFTFDVGTAASGAASAAAASAPGDSASMVGRMHDQMARTDFDASSPAYVAVRWLLYAGLLAMIGAVAFRSLVLARLDAGVPNRAVLVSTASKAAAWIGAGAAMLVLVSAVLRLCAQMVAMHGGSSTRMLGMMVGRTLWGRAWLLQLGGSLAALLGYASALRRQDEAGGRRGPVWPLVALGTLAVAFTPALSGHAASAPRLVPLAVLADGLHVLGAGGWLGSLLVLFAAGLPAAAALPTGARGGAAAALVEGFSPTALGFAALVTITGGFAAWLHVGSFAALWSSAYGRTLLIKLAMLSGVIATGAYNFRRVRPALTASGDTAGLRRSTAVELGVGVLVLVVTAILVATPTATDLLASR